MRTIKLWSWGQADIFSARLPRAIQCVDWEAWRRYGP